MQSTNLTEARAMRDAYATDSEREAFAAGYGHAHGIACHNVPRIGTEYFIEGEGRVTAHDAGDAAELHAALCYAAESNARCYSPWEYTAHEINGCDDPDAAWEAYEDGVAAAIAHDLASYTAADYEGGE